MPGLTQLRSPKSEEPSKVASDKITNRDFGEQLKDIYELRIITRGVINFCEECEPELAREIILYSH